MCELNLQAYSHTGLQLKHVAQIHLTVGPMDLMLCVLFNNCTAQDIHVTKASHLGWLINQAFHDFELTVPVKGPIPAQLMSDEYNDTITFTKPHEIIAINSILPVSRESVS